MIRLPSFRGFSEPVSAHPDMLVFPYKDGILTYKEYYAENRAFFDNIGVNLYFAESTPLPLYPGDIALNALLLGGTLYGRTDCTDKKITALAKRLKFVKQGYTRCSTAVFGEKAAVTADTGIAKALEEDGVDVLTVKPGFIRLEGYDTGFIGGCGGMLEDGRYAFFGNLYSHPQGREIADFAAGHGAEIISLSDETLTDFGGIVSLGAV